MKHRIIPLLTIVASLSLTGCSFFDYIFNDETEPVAPWTGNKTTLSFTQKEFTPASYYENDTMPTSGNPKLLVLPIAFKDSDRFFDDEGRATIKDRLEKACFGTNEETGWYSITSFYETESFGECIIEGEVADWYECGYNYSAVNSTDVTERVVKDAVDDWKYKNPDKVKEFDSDENGFLDGVMVIYGGPNYNNYEGHPNRNMWAYTSWLDTIPNVDNPKANVYLWASYDFMDSGIEDGIINDTHTYVHEMGHVFGLDDYYDYAEKGIWAGGFSMQDYNVGGHDPYSLMVLGWAKPYVPTSSASITIKPFESSGDMILLSPDFSKKSAYDEYLLIEYYTPTGTNEHDTEYQYLDRYPQGPSKGGIRIWHVDARLLKIINKQGTKTYSIVNTIDESDGKYIVGCTNTTYIEGASTNAYCSLASELWQYKLLELIRRSDFTAIRTDEYLTYDHLFKEGDTFNISKYPGYFRNQSRLNDGSRFNWNVKIDSITDKEATITVTI